MNNVRRFRAMGSLCRQQAAYNPSQSWKLLAEAEYWEHLAQAEMSSHFKECNTTISTERAKPVATSSANDTRCETVAAA
jgi:hypothetical protein